MPPCDGPPNPPPLPDAQSDLSLGDWVSPPTTCEEVTYVVIHAPVIGNHLVEVEVGNQEVPMSPFVVTVLPPDCGFLRVPTVDGLCVCAPGAWDVGGRCFAADSKLVVVILALLLTLLALGASSGMVYMRTQLENSWRIPFEEITLTSPVEVIGRGTYGLVIKGFYRASPVALKRMLPRNGSRRKDDVFDLSFDQLNQPAQASAGSGGLSAGSGSRRSGKSDDSSTGIMGMLGLRESARRGVFAKNAANYNALDPTMQRATALGATEQSPLAVIMATLGMVAASAAEATPASATRLPGIRATPPASPAVSYKQVPRAAAGATVTPSSPRGVSLGLPVAGPSTPPPVPTSPAAAPAASPFSRGTPSTPPTEAPPPRAASTPGSAPTPTLTPALTAAPTLKSAMRSRSMPKPPKPVDGGVTAEWVAMSGTYSGGGGASQGLDGGGGGYASHSKLVRELRLQGIKEGRPSTSAGDASGSGPDADAPDSWWARVVTVLRALLRVIRRGTRLGSRFFHVGRVLDSVSSLGGSMGVDVSLGSWLPFWGSSGARTQRNMSKLRNEFINEIRVVVHLRHPNITTVRGGHRFQGGGGGTHVFLLCVRPLPCTPASPRATPFRQL